MFHVEQLNKKGEMKMARLMSRRGMYDLLRKIMETGGLTESMSDDFQRLKDDFDERERMLRRYGEVYDGEDQEYYDYTPRDVEDWESRYNELRDEYQRRFWGTDEVREKVEEIKEETEEDVKRDGNNQTFDELLERVEG